MSVNIVCVSFTMMIRIQIDEREFVAEICFKGRENFGEIVMICDVHPLRKYQAVYVNFSLSLYNHPFNDLHLALPSYVKLTLQKTSSATN